MASCNWRIAELPGLSAERQALLKDHGIQTTHQLLLATRTPQATQQLAHRLKIHPSYILKWVALADLARLPSIGTQYCGLVLHSGIASVNQLSQTSFSRLHQNILKLQVANLQRKDLTPPVGLVRKWVNEAQRLR